MSLLTLMIAACSGGGAAVASPGGAAVASPGAASSATGGGAYGGPATVPSPAPAAGAGGGGTTGGPVAAGDDLCGLLGPGDFGAVGVSGTGKPTENNTDNSNVYCVYAGKSAGTGGVEFDAFLADTAADSQGAFDAASAPMLDFEGAGKAAFPDADGAKLRTDIPGGYAGITIWKGKLVFDIGIPTTAQSKDQLVALAKLVLERAKGLTG